MEHLLEYGIEEELNQSLMDKIENHRKNFIRIFKARYLEILPSLIKYNQSHEVAVDFLKVETALRAGYNVVIGETTKNNIQVIGYTNSDKTSSNPKDLWGYNLLDQNDIQFIIPEHLRFETYKEISDFDSCKTGNFVVLRNKTLNYVNDYSIIDHYTLELAEIVVSRFSISMQVKVTSLFKGDVGDETTNQLITNIYKGNPYIKVSDLFDPADDIYHMNNDNIAQNFQELKREYQNKISELNNMIGMNSLAVEKSSGVSDEEAKSNRGYTTSNANIYLDGRNNGLRKLNKRYETTVQAVYNDEVLSEFAEFEREVESNENNDNTV